MKFTDLSFNSNILKAIEDVGFTDCTPVQEKTFQAVMNEKDVCVQSQTGTGKTAAFLISIFHLFQENPRFKEKKALIIAPTRELAIQIEEEAQVLGKYCGFKSGCFYGGVGYGTQEKLLQDGLNLYIGTPGRLIDFYKSKKIDFSKMEIVVVDEADRMFDMGFIQDIRYILKHGKKPTERLTLLFSATLGTRVKRLAWESMNEPVEIEIEPETMTVDKVTQGIYHVGKRQKFNLLLGILKKDNPKSAIIFSNTKHYAEMIALRLKANGYEAEHISGDLPQSKRLAIIDSIKEGKIPILVATDVAARGLHVDDLEMVINYDLPQDPSNYVHRIGRTARAGKEGKAISLACEDTVYYLAPIEEVIAMKIPEFDYTDEMLMKDESSEELLRTRKKRPEGSDRRGKSDHSKPKRNSRSASPRRVDSLSNDLGIATTQQSKIESKEQPMENNKRSSHAGKMPAASRPQSRPSSKLSDRRSSDSSDNRHRASHHEEDEFSRQRVSRKLSLAERIKIYEKKYGKDFVYKKPAKKGIVSKIFSIFAKKD